MEVIAVSAVAYFVQSGQILVHRVFGFESVWPAWPIEFDGITAKQEVKSYLGNAMTYYNQTWYTDSGPCSDYSEVFTQNSLAPLLAKHILTTLRCIITKLGIRILNLF